MGGVFRGGWKGFVAGLVERWRGLPLLRLPASSLACAGGRRSPPRLRFERAAAGAPPHFVELKRHQDAQRPQDPERAVSQEKDLRPALARVGC